MTARKGNKGGRHCLLLRDEGRRGRKGTFSRCNKCRKEKGTRQSQERKGKGREPDSDREGKRSSRTQI